MVKPKTFMIIEKLGHFQREGLKHAGHAGHAAHAGHAVLK